MKNITKNFWNGKISLWKSYWLVGELLNGIIILIIINFEITFFNNNIENQFPIFSFEDFNLFSKVIIVFWTIFITVGIWRSAENYKGNLIWIILSLILLSYRVFSLRIIFF